MLKMVSDEALPGLQIIGVNGANAVLDALKKKMQERGSQAKINVYDAAAYLKNHDGAKTSEILKDGISIMLLDASGEMKQQLVSHIGLGVPGVSEALVITGVGAASARMNYLLNDLPRLAPIDATIEPTIVELEYPEGASQPKDDSDQDANAAEVHAENIESIQEAYAIQVLESLANPPEALTSGSTQPESQKWIQPLTLNWPCPQGQKSHGHTPMPQNTYVTITYTFTAYLDQQASGNFQWLEVDVLGYQSVGSKGMNQDYSNQRGWANGFIDVQIPTPSGFTVYSTTPNNVNNATTYTSSASFTVGVDSDGPSGSVQISNSNTVNITDWAIKQNDINNWTFYQQNPWDSRTEKSSSSMASYNTTKFCYELKPLPNLSTGLMNFSTMSVWNNQKVTTAILPVTINITAEWDYVGLHNSWPTATVSFWYYQKSTSSTYLLDMSLVS